MREQALSLRRRIAFVACYLSVALFALFPTPAYGLCSDGECENLGCSCVGLCYTTCYWTNETTYCQECKFDVAEVYQNEAIDGPNCEYVCCQTSYSRCN